MKKIVIFGAGGLGREVQWLIERINERKVSWEMMGYIDDGMDKGTIINGYKVLGGTDFLKQYNEPIYVVCAIGSATTRKRIVEEISGLEMVYFPNLIDPSVKMSDFVQLGKGNIICAGTILTVNIRIEDFCIINLDCTIGHDDILDSFVTIYPSVNISGNVHIGRCSELGTGTQIIQGIKIKEDSIIGAGSVVVKDLEESGTYVGAPVKIIK
mgnify:FL=1